MTISSSPSCSAEPGHEPPPPAPLPPPADAPLLLLLPPAGSAADGLNPEHEQHVNDWHEPAGRGHGPPLWLLLLLLPLLSESAGLAEGVLVLSGALYRWCARSPWLLSAASSLAPTVSGGESRLWAGSMPHAGSGFAAAVTLKLPREGGLDAVRRRRRGDASAECSGYSDGSTTPATLAPRPCTMGRIAAVPGALPGAPADVPCGAAAVKRDTRSGMTCIAAGPGSAPRAFQNPCTPPAAPPGLVVEPLRDGSREAKPLTPTHTRRSNRDAQMLQRGQECERLPWF